MIGVDIGGSAVKAIRWDGAEISAAIEVAAPLAAEKWLEQIAGLVEALQTSTRGPVGVAVAGLVRWPEGVLAWAPHLDGTEVPVRSWLEARFARPVIVDNDANCAALAELIAGSARNVNDALMLTLGTGIGMGLIVNGDIYRGRSFAGEAGHMTMIPDGALCACGRRGCWETLVSGTALADGLARLIADMPGGPLAAPAGAGEGPSAVLSRAAADGHSPAADVLRRCGRWLGRGVANLIALLDPELVVVGGGAVESASDLLLEAARNELEVALEGAEHRPIPAIVAATHGRWAGAIGAALAASAYPGR
ncbi:MAG: ROK family protein [Actinomycetota bacterium]